MEMATVTAPACRQDCQDGCCGPGWSSGHVQAHRVTCMRFGPFYLSKRTQHTKTSHLPLTLFAPSFLASLGCKSIAVPLWAEGRAILFPGWVTLFLFTVALAFLFVAVLPLSLFAPPLQHHFWQACKLAPAHTTFSWTWSGWLARLHGLAADDPLFTFPSTCSLALVPEVGALVPLGRRPSFSALCELFADAVARRCAASFS